jgi:hypothetical protein
MSRIDPTKLTDINELNEIYAKWLDEDYVRKPHSALSMSPLDYYMSQTDRIRYIGDQEKLDEAFLMRVNRTIHSDGTFSIDNILFETERHLAGKRLQVRYEPEWLKSEHIPVYLYEKDRKVSQARKVNFHDNSHVRRRGRKTVITPEPESTISKVTDTMSTISYAAMEGK